MKRTHLPLNALRVFDAAARHLSFTKAADELAVTPAAVGQQIRALEDVLGVVLFRRMTRNLELTPEAERALPALRAGFLHFEECVHMLQEGQGSRTITIAAPRDLTSKWLASRLAAYGRAHPDMRFVLSPMDGGVDFSQANLDVAVVYDAKIDGEELKGEAFGPDTLVTIGAPNSIGDGRETFIEWPGAPVRAQEEANSGGLSVGDAGLAIDAAAAGYGITTVPHLLVAQDVHEGRVRQIGEVQTGAPRYWLIAPAPQWRQAKVRALVDFLLQR